MNFSKNYSEEYKDIINLPHHVSKKHNRMSIEARSAQFAPFAALTGYDDVIKETARLTNERRDIDESLKIILDEKLQIIEEKILSKPLVTFTYFVPDSKKNGGSYKTVIGNVKRVDEYRNLVILEDKTEIPISEIIEIDGEMFEDNIRWEL